MIVRWHKDQSYFIVRLYQDLVGDWVVTECWGHSGEEDDGSDVSHTVTASYQQARGLLDKINQRQVLNGFERLPEHIEQLSLNF